VCSVQRSGRCLNGVNDQCQVQLQELRNKGLVQSQESLFYYLRDQTPLLAPVSTLENWLF